MNPSIQFSRHDLNPLSVLSLNKEVPLPAGVAPGTVRVQLKARVINPADVLFVQGLYGRMVGDQIQEGKTQTGGTEGSGVIVAIGEGVVNVRVGQRVYISSPAPVTRIWSEFADVPALYAVPLPDAVDFASGAQLLVNPLTAIGFLETLQKDGLKDGDVYVLTGGNSALCKMVLQLARLRGLGGLRAVCVVRSAAVRGDLVALGAYAVVAQDETPDVAAAVRAHAPNGVRATFDALGGGQVAGSLIGLLAPGSAQYVYGLLTPETLPVTAETIGDMLFRGARLEGWYLGNFLSKNGERLPALFGEVLGYLAKGELVFKSRTFDFLTEWADAVSYTMDGSKQGKTVLVSK